MASTPTLSRRGLLAGGVVALSLLAVAPTLAVAKTPNPYSLDAWTALQGQELTLDGGTVLRVAEVTDLRRPARVGEVDSSADRFRLTFTLVTGTLTENLVTMHLPGGASVLLFLTHDATRAVASIDRRVDPSTRLTK